MDGGDPEVIPAIWLLGLLTLVVCIGGGYVVHRVSGFERVLRKAIGAHDDLREEFDRHVRDTRSAV